MSSALASDLGLGLNYGRRVAYIDPAGVLFVDDSIRIRALRKRYEFVVSTVFQVHLLHRRAPLNRPMLSQTRNAAQL